MKRNTLLLYLISPLALLVIGCSETTTTVGTGQLRLWAMPDSVEVHADSTYEAENSVFSASARTIRLDAAINEKIAFQLVMRGDGRPATVRSVSMTDPKSGSTAIPQENIRLYKAGWITADSYPTWYLRLTPYLKGNRLYADPLVPLDAPQGALPIQVPPNRCEIVWVEIAVPPGSPPGQYQSQLTVQSGPDRADSYDVQIQVHPFALPDARHLPIMAGFTTQSLLAEHLMVQGRPYTPGRISREDPAFTEITALIDATARLLHEHRCTPIPRDIEPQRTLNERGDFALGWQDYDRLVDGLISGKVFADSMPAPCWPMPIDSDRPLSQSRHNWVTTEFARLLAEHFSLCLTHFQERGWLDRHYIWLPTPGPSRTERYRQDQWLGQLIDRVDPRLNLVSNLTPNSLVPYGRRQNAYRDITDWVEIWCPPASLADHQELAEQRARGKRTWLMPDRLPHCGSLSLIAPPTSMRCIPWHAFRFGHEAVMLPAVNRWVQNLPDQAQSEQALIWPGRPYGLQEPIPSIRLKRLLRGAQDYEYLWLLSQNARPGIAELIATDLVPYGGTSRYGDHYLDYHPHGWVTDPAPWMLARDLMLRELDKVMAGRDKGIPEDVARFEQQIEWARFTQTVRRLHLQIEGAKVHLVPSDRQTPVHIEAEVWLLNTTREPVSGELNFVNLPEGWRMSEPAAIIDRLQPLQGVRKIVRVAAPPIIAENNGTIPFKIALLGSYGPSAGATVEPLASDDGRLCVLTAQALTPAPTIDGRLDEWALGSQNVAGDFVLVGALDVPKIDRPEGIGMSVATDVFVANDRDYLYLAFKCEQPGLQTQLFTRNNYITYEDLWPRGEDLVEIVIDPDHRAIDAGDLLHIAIKPNGAVLTEYGAACLAPVAAHKPWPALVRAAVHPDPATGYWTAEIRIPLENLGPRSDVMGINFARYVAERGEYGTWSGARRYLYKPFAMGNLRLNDSF